jgi:hypothetical protein
MSLRGLCIELLTSMILKNFFLAALLFTFAWPSAILATEPRDEGIDAPEIKIDPAFDSFVLTESEREWVAKCALESADEC